MTSSHSYRRLIIDREIGPLLFAANFGRLSGGIVPFGLVAFYSDRQEYIHAGVASAVLMVVSSLTAPYKGRLITRYSPRATIVPMSLVFALLLGTGVTLNASGASFVVAMAGIVSGAAVAPPTPAVVRAIWTNVAETPATNRALHALDSTTEELTFAISPLITSVLWATGGVFWSIPVGLCAGVLGNIAIVVLASRREASSHALMTRPLPGPPASNELFESVSVTSKRSIYFQPAAVGLLLPMVGLGIAMGGAELDSSRLVWAESWGRGDIRGVIECSQLCWVPSWHRVRKTPRWTCSRSASVPRGCCSCSSWSAPLHG